MNKNLKTIINEMNKLNEIKTLHFNKLKYYCSRK